MLIIRFNNMLLPFSSGKCTTRGGEAPDTPCVLQSWIFNDEAPVYDGCANPDGDPGGQWCPTGLTGGKYITGSGKWGYCKMEWASCNKSGKASLRLLEPEANQLFQYHPLVHLQRAGRRGRTT